MLALAAMVRISKNSVNPSSSNCSGDIPCYGNLMIQAIGFTQVYEKIPPLLSRLDLWSNIQRITEYSRFIGKFCSALEKNLWFKI